MRLGYTIGCLNFKINEKASDASFGNLAGNLDIR